LAEPAPEVVIVVPTLGTRLDYLELCVASLMRKGQVVISAILIACAILLVTVCAYAVIRLLG
jgi:hypothetical protein